MTHSQDAIWQQVYSGQWYQTHHPQLVQARELAKRLCRELNQLPMSDEAKRQALICQLLPNARVTATGSDFACDYGINIYAETTVIMGDRVVILDAAPVSIGANVTIEDGVVIASLTHPLEAAKRKAGWQQASPVKIGDNVVLSEGCTILPGAVIPAGAVIEPGKVVTR
ncbi:sugar O-acetyltransferase [Alteromonas sp. ZYF713]|nr:sugar O-acetyltransferase [Alteromonas sp. ZYF713]